MFLFLYIQVPIVTVVVEGGPDTLATIYKDLSNDIPIVLVDVSNSISIAFFLNRIFVSVG